MTIPTPSSKFVIMEFRQFYLNNVLERLKEAATHVTNNIFLFLMDLYLSSTVVAAVTPRFTALGGGGVTDVAFVVARTAVHLI